MSGLKLKLALLNVRDIQRACLGYWALKIISQCKSDVLTISEIGREAETELNLVFPSEYILKYTDEQSLGQPYRVHYATIHAVVDELIKQKLVESSKDKITYRVTPKGTEIMKEWEILLKRLISSEK